MRWSEKVFQVVIIVLLSLMSVLMIYPFVHTLSISLSTPAEAIRSGFHFYPRQFSYSAYKLAFGTDLLWIGFFNSAFRTVVGTVLSLAVMLLAAYPLSKKYLPYRAGYTLVILFTMFFNGGLIPTYLTIREVGLLNSRWIYVLGPGFFISTFSLLILRNFLMAVPAELEDSAKIDGAGELRILWHLIIPLSKPVLATLGLWSAVAHWNSWFDGLIYIQSRSAIVVQVVLRRLVIENMVTDLDQFIPNSQAKSVQPAALKAAVTIIVTLPILLVYPFLQKYFVKGVMIGSLKG